MDIAGAPLATRPETGVLSVLLVERTSLLREALAAVLSIEADLDVTTVGTVTDLLPTARSVRPHVVVVNIDLLATAGLPLVKALTEAVPGCEVLALADADNGIALRGALDLVRGLVDRDAPPSRLADRIRRVAGGERVVDPSLAVAARRALRDPFTPRERDVLRAMALGLPSVDIAVQLNVANGTVGNYISAIIRKTGARNRLEAVRVAVEAGWVRAPGRRAASRSR